MTSEKRFTPSLREVFLVEDSRGNIVRLLKLPRDVADVFHVADPKHAFTLAKVFKADLSYNNQNAWEAREWFEDAYGRSLLDFLRKHPQSAKDFEKIEPGHEVYLVVRDIVKRAVSGKDVSQLKARAEIKFPDGFFWMKLDPEECRAEGDAMGHCGQDDRGDLWSLRDKQGNPHVTMTFDGEIVHQIKGKGNRIPDQKYWDHIKKFFEKTQANLEDEEVYGTGFEKYIVEDPEHEELKQRIVDALKQVVDGKWHRVRDDGNWRSFEGPGWVAFFNDVSQTGIDRFGLEIDGHTNYMDFPLLQKYFVGEKENLYLLLRSMNVLVRAARREKET
jgi:hypothetical protein